MKHIAWIDTLPGRWKMKPLRAVADYVVSNVDKVTSDGEVPVRLCNYTDVYKNEFIRSDFEYMHATASRQEVYRFGLSVDDVIITKDSESWKDIGVPALVVETSDDLVCGYHLALLRPHKDAIHGAFLFRCLQAKSVRIQLELAANGVTRFGLPKTEIGKTILPVPPLSIQRAIADYLDRETARLDALIVEKERLLKLLAEKHQSLITHAVTRGLEPSSSIRNSGISWLGEIPDHWKVERARWLFRERDQRSATGDEELLTVSHLTGVTPRSEKEVHMFEAETTEGYKLCMQGDLVINTLWAWMGAMGISPVDGLVSPAYNVYEPTNRLDPTYLDALSRLPIFAQEVIRYSKGVWSSRLRLYPEGFFEIFLPVPPLSEQKKIASLLKMKGKKLDALQTAAMHTIALLKERRAALISTAVTGQIDVGGVG